MQSDVPEHKKVVMCLWKKICVFSKLSSGMSYSAMSIGLMLRNQSYASKQAIAQSCPTLRNPMDCSLPGFSVHGIFQARVLEWVAISFFRDKENYLEIW